MKIIKRGGTEETGTQVTCDKCKSELEYFPADIIQVTTIDSQKSKHITCAVCNQTIKVE